MIQRLPLLFGLFVFACFAQHTMAQSTVFFPANASNPTCNGNTNGSIVFDIQGDSTDFFFNWSGGNLPTGGHPVFGLGVRRQTGLRAGTYSVFILDLNTGIDTTIEAVLTNPVPISVNAGNTASACLGLGINLSATTNAASGSIIRWSYTNANGPQTITGTNISIPAPPSPQAITSNTTISVLLTDPNSCTATDQLMVTINPVPVGSANPSTTSICSGPVSIALSSNLSGTTFVWSVSQSGTTGASGGSGLAINQNVRATGVSSGTATYSIRPIAAGCFGPSFTSVVTVRPKPIASANPDSSVICSGSQSSVALSSNIANSSFAWRAIPTNVTGSSSSTGSNIQQTLNTSGTSQGKVVYRVAASANGCLSDSIRVVVDVKPRPTLTVLPSDTINVCSGLQGTFRYGSNFPNANIVWTANPNSVGAISGTGATNTQTYTNASTSTLRATFDVVADFQGCSSNVRQTRVRVRPLPNLTITSKRDTICSGQALEFALGSNLSGTNFGWTSAATAASGNANPGSGNVISDVLTATGSGIGSVIYQVRGTKEGCPGPVSVKTAYVYPNPTAVASPSRNTICSGGNSAISISSPISGTTFSWTAAAGTISGASNGSGNSISQILTNAGSGLDSVTYSITSRLGTCTGILSKAVVLVRGKSLPTANQTNPGVCDNGRLLINITSPGTWSWIVSGSGVAGAVAGSGNSINQTLSLTTAQDRTIAYKIFGIVNGCISDTLRIPVIVNQNPVLSLISAADSICPGQSAQIQINSAPANNVNISWTATATNVTGASNGSGSLINQTLNLSSGTLGKVVYNVSANRIGCIGSKKDSVFVRVPVIQFTATPSTTTLCSGNAVQINLAATVPNVTFSWTVVASGVSGALAGSGNQINNTLTLQGLGSGFVDYVITPKSGSCVGIAQTIRITVQTSPVKPVIAISGGTSPICPGKNLTLTSDQLFGNQWTFNGTPISAPIGNQRTLIASDSGVYRVVFTQSAGCVSTSDPFRIQFLSTPTVPVISGNNGFCPGLSSRISSSNLTGNQWQINGSDIPGATNSSYQATIGGDYSIRTTGSTCSVNSAIFKVTAFPAPAQPSISGNNFLCFGDSGLLSSTPASAYQWTRNGSILINEIGQTLKVKQSGNYRVQISDVNTCTSTSNIYDVQGIPANPTPTITGILNFCPGDSTILSTGNQNPAWKNQWFRDGILLTNDTLRTLIVKQTGVYTVNLKSPRACISRSSPSTVSERSVPPVPIISGLSLLCPGGQITLSSSATSGNIWFLNGFQINGANDPTYVANAVGSYSISVINSQGCKATSANFSISPTSDIQATALISDPTSCGQANGSIQVTSSGGSGKYKYVWSPTTGGIIQGKEDQLTVASGTYSVMVTDSLSGCSQLIAGIVLNDPATFTASAQVTNVTSCSSSNGRINLTVNQNTGPYTFQWAGPSNATTQNINNIAAGLYSVTITQTSSGCKFILDSILVNSNVPPKPEISASGPLEFCQGDSIVLKTTASGSYQWFRLGSGAINGQTVDSLVVKTSGGYFVRATNPGFPNCFSRSDTLTVTIHALPSSPNINASNTEACEGVSISLSSTSNLNKQWILNGQDLPGKTGSFLEVSTGGVYCLRVSDANGCSRVSNNCRTITINPIPPKPVIAGTLGFCPGGQTSLSFSPFEPTLYRYTWLRNNDFIGTVNTASLTVNISGWYKVRSVNEATNCRIFGDSVFVEAFNSPPAPSISGPSSICSGSSSILVSSQAATYQWFRNGQIINGANNDSLQISQSGAYTVSITDFNGCGSTSTAFAVSEIASPTASTVTGNSSFCLGSSTILTASVNSNYQWLFNGSPLLGQTGQTISVASFGNYQVLISNTIGCSDTSVIFTTIQSAASFTVDTSITATSCVNGSAQNNGQISVTTIGGSGNFAYNWIPSLPANAAQTNLSTGYYSVLVKDQISGCAVNLDSIFIKPTPSLQASLVIVNDSRCDINNGSISLTVSGGAGNYLYTWTGLAATGNTVSGLGLGNYEVLVTDIQSACSKTFGNLTVAGVDTFAASASLTQPTTCSGFGSIVISSNGGSGNFTYDWSGTGSGIQAGLANQTGLSAGNYTVVVTDTTSKCLRTLSNLILIDGSNISLSTQKTDPTSCGGNDGTATVSTGIAGATYLWKQLAGGTFISSDSAAKGLAAGTYRIKVSKGTCSDSTELVLNQGGFLLSYVSDSANCADQNGTASVSSTANVVGATYTWSKIGNPVFSASGPAQTNLSSGTYKVLVLNGFCKDSIQVLVPKKIGCVAPVCSLNVTTRIIIPGFIVDCNMPFQLVADVTGATSPTFEWLLQGNPTVLSSSNPYSTGNRGQYQVIATDGLCKDTASLNFLFSPTIASSLIDSSDCANSNGSIALTINGNASDFTFSWTKLGAPGFTANTQNISNLSAGTYQVAIVSLNPLVICGETKTFQVFQKKNCAVICSLSVSAIRINPTACGLNNGSASATVVGGINPTFVWTRLPSATIIGNSANLPNLGGGTYQVIVKDGACADTALVTLLAPGSFTFSATPVSATCADNDGSINLTVNGAGAGVQFTWTKIGVPSFTANTQNLINLSAGTYKVVIRDGACKDSANPIVRKPVNCGGCNLQVLASSTPVTCAGVSNGTAFAFVTSGGVGPYAYQLNNEPALTLPEFLATFSDQPAGPFSVIVKDETTFCSDTVSGIIGAQLALSASAFTQNPNCGSANGSIRVVVNGGSGPYTFTLGTQTLTTNDGDTTFTGLIAGTYSVSINNALGCATSISDIVLTQPQKVLVGYGMIKPASCSQNADGSVVISTLGGSAAFNYFIPNVTSGFQTLLAGDTLKNLKAGTYQLLIRGQSACDKDTSFIIPGPAPVNVSVISIASSACQDSTGTARYTSLTGGNGAPWTYNLWLKNGIFQTGILPADSSFKDLAPGNYSLAVQDSKSCTDTALFSIQTQTTVPLVSITSDKTQICSGDTVNLTASNVASIKLPIYSWYLNGKALNVNTASLQIDTLKNGDSVQVKLSGIPECLNPDSVWSNAIRFNVLQANAQMLAAIEPIRAQACIGLPGILKAINVNNLPNVGYRWIVNGVRLPTDTNQILTLFPGLPVNRVQAIIFSRSTSSCIGKSSDTSDVQLVTQVEAMAASNQLKQIMPAVGQIVCPNTPVTFAVVSTLKGKIDFKVQWWKNDTLVATSTDTFFTFNGLGSNAKIQAIAVYDTALVCVPSNFGKGKDSTNSTKVAVLPAGDIRCKPCSLAVNANPTNINCAGGATGAISVQASGGSGRYNYSLTPNGPSNQTFPFFFGLLPGTYAVQVKDSVSTCSTTVSGINIIVQNAYNVVVSAVNPTPCRAQADGTLEFVTVSDVSGDVNKYKFRIRASDAYGTNRLFTGLAAGSYTMEVIDTISGCFTQVVRTLTAPAALNARISVVSSPTCYGQFNARIDLDTVINGSGFYQYSLSGDSGTYAGIGINNPIPQGFGAGQVLLFFKDLQTGCIDTALANINQPDSLKLRASVLIGSQCFAPTGQIRLREFSGGTGAGTLTMKLPGSNTFLPVTVPADSILQNLIGGDYLFLFSDANNCTKQIIVTVPGNNPRAQITIVKPCIGDTNGIIRLDGLSGGSRPYTFTLSNDQGDVLKVQPDSVFSQLKPGTYGIKMQDASSPACETNYVTVIAPVSKVLFTLVGVKPSTCENFDGLARFTLSGGQAPFSYAFDSVAGAFTAYKSVTSDTLSIAGLSIRAAENPYTLRLLDSGPNGGCAYDTSFNVPGNSPLRYKYKLRNVKCFGENSGAVLIDSLNGTGPVTLKVVDAGTGELVKTDSIPGNIFLNNQFTLGGIRAGQFNLLVQQFGECNASRIIAFSISQPTQINISARQYKPSAEGFAMGSVLLDTVKGSIRPYQVSFNEGAFFDYKPDTLFDQLNPGVYKIFVQDSIGCELSKDIEVLKDQALFVPTMFTPNGDGMNDLFEIRNLPPGSSLNVRSRWGKEVYNSNSYDNKWAGKDLQDGTYYYSLKIPNQDSQNGWIEIKH